MFKKAWLIALLGIGLVAMLGTKSEAHWLQVGGRLFYHSLLCSWDLKGVPNSFTNPAVAECVAAVSLVEILCENPQNQQVQPGQAATQTIIVAQEQIDEGNVTGKGKAHVEVIVPDDPLLNPEFCVNPNWHPIQALVREVTVQLNVFECTSADCSTKVLASMSQLECVLPLEFDFENPPVPDETEYQCTETSRVHVQ